MDETFTVIVVVIICKENRPSIMASLDDMVWRIGKYYS
jgi:hypothetical protein